MKKIYHSLFFIIILWNFFIILHAEYCQASNVVVELTQMSIQDLMQVTVSSVGFFDLPPEKAPGSIQIITTQQIENSPANGLADILDLYISGIHISNNNKNGASYAVRGLRMPDNSTTVVMYDGQNINTAAGLGVNMNLDLPLMGDISQLEVIKGPCALVHGSGAMNGFVNIIPKNGTENPGYFYNMQYGFKENLAKLENAYGFSYGHKKDFFIYLGSAYAEGFESQDIYGFEKILTNRDIKHSYKCRFFDPSFRISLNWNHNNFHVTTLLQNDRGSSNSKYSYLIKPMEYYQGMFLTSLSWKSQVTQFEKLEIHIPISFYDLGLIAKSIDPREKIREEGGSECHFETRFIFKTHRLNKHSIAFGGLIGYRHFRAGDYYLSQDPIDDGRLLDSDWDEFGFFFEDVIQFSPKWNFSFGFRYDILDNSEMVIPDFINDTKKNIDKYEQECKNVSTSRIAVSYKFTPDDIFKLSFQEGYHQSNMFNFYEIFYGSMNLQDDLKPELMSSLEFNYQHSEPELGVQMGLNLFLNAYENSFLVETGHKKGDMATPILGEEDSEYLFDDIFGNGPSFASMGVELDLDWQITSNTDLFLSYAFTKPHNIEEEENIRVSIANEDCSKWLSYPTHIIKSAFRKNFLNDRLNLNLHAIYTSSIDAAIKESPSPGKQKRMGNFHKLSQYYPPSLTIHASMAFKVTDQLTFRVIGRNIFDNDHPHAGFHFSKPWEGNLGEGSPLVYLGITWKE